MDHEKREKAIDLSHHLSNLSRARQTSPLKGLAKYFGRPGLISLAGGMPSPGYFPFADVSANALVPDSFDLNPVEETSSISWIWKLFGAGSSSKEKTTSITVPKYPSKPDDVNLAVALQYGTAKGMPQLIEFLQDFVEKVYQPAYSDATVLLEAGNTDGWSRAVFTFCNPGEFFLTEDWTYPSAVATALPYGVKPAAVKMDNEGMRSDDLRDLLEHWDVETRGGPRPHVMYTVPVGQNPSGVTMGLGRKKEIYDVCVEYDIIIVEDDPYYFLQEGVYKPKGERVSASETHDPAKFIASLAPSFLKVDYQGRVVRLDTFSKTIAPGSRLGWFTCNPVFAERLERQGETTTQAPCGFSQALITQLLLTWGYDNWTRWLHGLSVEYTHRRDFLLDGLMAEFHTKRTIGAQGVWAGMDVYEVYSRPKSHSMIEKSRIGNKMFSFVPPTSGMFVWIKMHFDDLPSFKEGDEETLEMQLWEQLAEAGLLIAPGWFFSAYPERVPEKRVGHFRISFSFGDEESLTKAVRIMAKIFGEFYGE